MRVAFIGNMNNQLFQQQEYFEGWGYDTTLFLLEEHDHFMPEADVFFDPYQKYKIVHLGWGIENFHTVTPKEVRERFTGFDVLIGTDLAPAYLYKGGLKLDIFCLHGSDVYEYPFYRFKKGTHNLWTTNKVSFSLCQFEGVKLANYLALFKMDDLYEKPLSLIRKKGKRMPSIPYIYLPRLTDDFFEKSSMTVPMRELKQRFPFLIMHHCSHNWHTYRDSLIYKGNDRVIRAFADYFHRSKQTKKACLVLLEYGPDVDRSKAMIRELGISDNVFWFPKQNRKDLLAAINMCDMGIGELGVQGWMLYSVIVEFIILSKPSIHYRNSPIYQKYFSGLYDMVDTNDPAVVTETLLDYERDPQIYKAMGLSAKNWFLDNLHNVSLAAFKEKLNEVAGNNKAVRWWEYLRYSNLTERIKVTYWYYYNAVRIKLFSENK